MERPRLGRNGDTVMDTVNILYTNHKGETAWRHVRPYRIRFTATPWHPEPQWILDARDLDKDTVRAFAMRDIKEWLVNTEPARSSRIVKHGVVK
jgi:predicted DNA-binding transcriptional regulator YafY